MEHGGRGVADSGVHLRTGCGRAGVLSPFTDLSGSKRRPALVVSPEGSHDEDLILCAITSQAPRRLSEQEILLEAGDMAQKQLPKKSVVKAGKLFTMHQRLIASRYGSVEQHKLLEVLRTLREIFADSEGV